MPPACGSDAMFHNVGAPPDGSFTALSPTNWLRPTVGNVPTKAPSVLMSVSFAVPNSTMQSSWFGVLHWGIIAE